MCICLCIGHTGLLVLFQHCDAERVSVTAAPCLQCLLLPRDNLLAFSQLPPHPAYTPPCQQSSPPHTDGKFMACPYHLFNPLLSIREVGQGKPKWAVGVPRSQQGRIVHGGGKERQRDGRHLFFPICVWTQAPVSFLTVMLREKS